MKLNNELLLKFFFRMHTLGSYYAVADYNAINPEFGTMDHWKELVRKCHAMGFKVIIDSVPNYTGADNHWLARILIFI